MSRKAVKKDKHIGMQLRLRRSMMHISQEELASNLGITAQQIQKYEKAINRISASVLDNIAQILQVPLSYFYDGFEEGTSFQIAEKEISSHIYDHSITPKDQFKLSQINIIERIINIPNGGSKDKLLMELNNKLIEYNY